MSAAEIRKTIGNVLVGLAGIGGQLSNATLVHGQGALWLAFGITVAQALAHAIVTYTVPNGATISQRVTALEAVALPAAETVIHALPASESQLEDPVGKLATLVTPAE